jgi:protein-lysine N-methyltransferase EEF2KMT
MDAIIEPRLVNFYRQYLQQVEAIKLSYPPDETLLDPTVQSHISRYMFSRRHGDEIPPLPAEFYQKQVLKNLVERIEAALNDPDEDVGLTCSD